MLATWKVALDTGFRICPPVAIAAGLTHLTNLATTTFTLRESDLGRGARWALAAAAGSTLGIVPFTLFVMQGVNRELFAREKVAREEARVAGHGAEAAVKNGDVELVKRWWRLNLVRAGLPALGAVCAAFLV